MKTVVAGIIAIIICSIIGCGRHSAVNTGLFDDKPITRPGEYLFSSGERLSILVGADRIVVFRLYNKSGSEELHSIERASANQRWSIYWEAAMSRLWFSSSDVGTSVWMKDHAGKYVQAWVADQKDVLKGEMPQLFFDTLPTDIQQEWKTLRKK